MVIDDPKGEITLQLRDIIYGAIPGKNMELLIFFIGWKYCDGIWNKEIDVTHNK